MTLPPAHARSDPPESESTSPARAFVEVLELTERERSILAAVRDRNEQLDEAAFYMLLDKCVEVASAARPRLDALDTPSFGNLVDYPERYRGSPIRANLRVIRVEKLAAPQDLSPPPHWSPGRNVWKLSCYPPRESSYSGTPVIVFTATEPTALGEPTKITEEGEHYYPGTAEYRIAGFYHKLYRFEGRDGKARYYPVIIAWALDSTDEKRFAKRDGPKTTRTLLLFLVGLLIIYLFTRRHIRRQRETAEEYRYQPLRDEFEEDEAASDRPDEGGGTGGSDPRPIDAPEDYDKDKES